MLEYLSHSLLLRAGLAMGLITALALGGMASAVFVARSTYGEAAAVNQAGSLRMQSYRVAAAVEAARDDDPAPFGDIKMLTTEFEQRLTSPRLVDVVNGSGRTSIRDAYRLVTDRWQHEMLPLLLNQMQQVTDSSAGKLTEYSRKEFGLVVGGFVTDIDNLVRLLEEDAESSIHMLGLFQGISLFLTLGVAFVTLYLLHIDVLGPLHALLAATERAGKGDFTARVGHTGADELGRLGRTFNNMAADLAKMYDELEQRVADKTWKLTQRNRSLELLYRTTQYLTEAPISERTYQNLLDDIGQVLGVDGIALCRREEGEDRAHLIAGNGPIPSVCGKTDCRLCLGDGRTRRFCDAGHDGAPDFISIRVGDEVSPNGVLLVGIEPKAELEVWQIQLLETLSKHIGISLDVARRVIQHRRLALLEERSVMARELHDSLAQSLTYLKIQATRISLITRSGEEKRGSMGDALHELQEGLDKAYSQLRELLTTFRLQIDGQGLGPALSKTVDEFSARSTVTIHLENKLKVVPFSVNQEIHVLQLVREALSNVVHHSKATKARVSLGFEDDTVVRVSVEDNGIGIPHKAERHQHYGLAIMHERAISLGGELRIERLNHGGTRVCLRFQPATDRKDNLSMLEDARL